MTRRALLQAAGAIVALVWNRGPAIHAEPRAPASARAAFIVDHQGWIVLATDRDALEGRAAPRRVD